MKSRENIEEERRNQERSYDIGSKIFLGGLMIGFGLLADGMYRGDPLEHYLGGIIAVGSPLFSASYVGITNWRKNKN